MLLRCIDKLIMVLKHDFKDVEKNLVKYKYNFGNDMVRELGLVDEIYCDTVFDYLFNLFHFRNAFTELDFKRYLEEFKDMDFTKSAHVCARINENYMTFVTFYKNFFMDYYGFKHEDPLYIYRKIEKNREDFRVKMLNYGNAIS